MAIDYQEIKRLAEEQGVKVDDLLAMSRANDPFYVGRPFEVAQAEWFADLWKRFEYQDGIHLRRMHYQIAMQPEPVATTRKITWKDPETGKKLETDVYINEDACWQYLNTASTCARHLGLVDPDAFIDKRNPGAVIYAHKYADAEINPDYFVSNGGSFENYTLPPLPSLRRLPVDLPDFSRLEAGGYDDIEQSYHVEIWAEKSTVNDVLMPICEEYGINLVYGLGELSITSVREFLHRVLKMGKPARILYISDLDPAGVNMPVSIARKIEFYQRSDGFGGVDIALLPIVLTLDQVQQYDLPRITIKDSDRRRTNFEAVYGKGAVELDALQALHPGELAKIVIQEIERYIDLDLWSKAREVKSDLQEELDRVWHAELDKYNGDLQGLEADYKQLLADFEHTRAEFEELTKPFQPKIDAYQERLSEIISRAREIYDDVDDDLENVTVDLLGFQLPAPDIGGDPDGVLYDSNRGYFEQLEVYKERKNGDGD